VKNSSILQQLSSRTTALTVHELARFLNVSEKTIYQEVQRGSIRCIPHWFLHSLLQGERRET
jgi:hypothetical protein